MHQPSFVHRTRPELEAALDHIRASPPDAGMLEMIVSRPAINAREVLDEGALDTVVGLIGDTWRNRGSSRTKYGSPHPEMQLTFMNTRLVDLVSGDRAHWPLAGDQLFVDLDLSEANLPPDTRLAVGSAVIEVTDIPHTGCGKFHQRFGHEATKFVNSAEGRALHLRGLNARVVRSGSVRVGDIVRKASDAVMPGVGSTL